MSHLSLSDERTAQTRSPLSGDIATTRTAAKEASAPTSIERLTDADRAEVLAHFMALSPYDRALRFGGSVSTVNVERYVDAMDVACDIVLGLRDDEDGLIGLAQICGVASDVGNWAEIAFSVHPSWRGRGCGTLLMQRVVECACHAGIMRLVAQVCSENTPMLALFLRAGMKLTPLGDEGDEEILATLDLDLSDQSSTERPETEAKPSASSLAVNQHSADV